MYKHVHDESHGHVEAYANVLDPRREPGAAQRDQGIGILSFLTAVSGASIVFVIQLLLFLLLRNKLSRIFHPKTYLVPKREQVEPPPKQLMRLFKVLWGISDRQVIEKCGLDAYFFLRYLKTLLVIFVPICIFAVPTLIPLNFIDGRGQQINANNGNSENGTSFQVTGLDILSWSNVSSRNVRRYHVHLAMAILVIFWVCIVLFLEFRVYIKVRQDHLTRAEHRLRASATTVLINSVPDKWLTEDALRGLFDAFPGGVRNVWLNRDLSILMEKIATRADVHLRLESAETELIKTAKQAQIARDEVVEREWRKRRGLVAIGKETREARCAQRDEEAVNMANERGRSDEENTEIDWRKSKYFQDIKRVIKGADAALSSTRDFKHLSSSSDTRHSGTCTTIHPWRRTASAWPRQSIARGNTVRELIDVGDLYVKRETKWWQFWKPPSGSFIPPVPQGSVTTSKSMEPLWKRIAKSFAISSSQQEDLNAYPKAYFDDYMGENNPAWESYIDRKKRPRHRLSIFLRLPFLGSIVLPGIPWISHTVDTIFWCRKELARLNVEIDQDQKHPERFPLMNSAFVQFNQQVAAHMACQCQIHHIPKNIAPRMIEISPEDVIWENMALTWKQQWIRTTIGTCILSIMIFLWSVPVSWTATFSHLDQLMDSPGCFSFIKGNATLEKITRGVAGVLPALVLGLVLFLIPLFLDYLAQLIGAKTKTQKVEFVQTFYFVFLFIQVFLVVSITSFFTPSLGQFLLSVGKMRTVNDVLNLLAMNLPRAANYFFSYMILQALSASSATLLQSSTLITWFIVARMIDTTARDKWLRNTRLCEVRWGAIFPTYTNFACIGLIYCIIAPLISVFAVVTFSFLWLSQRYAMLYIYRFKHDTGGLLYPRALNQTFLGIYIMELCISGLFFIAEAEDGTKACTFHGTVMLLTLILTAIYQILLNTTFQPLIRYLPTTYEDEAIIRDRTFEKAQDNCQDGLGTRPPRSRRAKCRSSLDGQNRNTLSTMQNMLYGGLADDIKDLTPEERFQLTYNAFRHSALRARPPTVWIPRDDLGVSDDEIQQTRRYSEHIAISNKGTALDSKGRVLYGKRPPDFSEIDLISL